MGAAKIKQWAEKEKIGPYITLGDKVINWYGGIVFGVPALFFGIFWYAAMLVVGFTFDRTGWNPKRSLYDNLGRAWNFLVLRLTGNYPRVITGLENRPKEGQAVLICANHASWYDILLAGYTLPATFKFISAAELADLPGVGKQLYGGKHVLIDRTSRKGQLRAFKDAVDWLSKGVSIFAFPEGTRSRDGRLKRFKPGVFSMALRAGVPILPVTIVDAFQPFPPNALLPIRQTTDMEMHFHPMIESEGRTDEELQKLVRDAIVSKLPAHQLPEAESTDANVS
jgi:1-acyl-sn-glycerol-3-phosphate acyltransferase